MHLANLEPITKRVDICPVIVRRKWSALDCVLCQLNQPSLGFAGGVVSIKGNRLRAFVAVVFGSMAPRT